MSRMTDERLAEIRKEREGWTCGAFRHSIELLDALEAERAKVAELEAGVSLAEEKRIVQLYDSSANRATLCGFAAQREAQWKAAEAQLTALPKWAQSSESKGQFYRKSVQEMAALREQLAALRKAKDNPECAVTNLIGGAYNCCGPRLKRLLREELDRVDALREGLEGLQRYDFTPGGMLTEFCGGCWVATDDIQSLLTQTTPTVNSEGSVISGEDSETPQQFTASLIEKRGEHFASLVMEALEDAL